MPCWIATAASDFDVACAGTMFPATHFDRVAMGLDRPQAARYEDPKMVIRLGDVANGEPHPA